MPKLLMIKPSQILDGEPLKFEKSLSPTRAMPYVAGLTPPEFDITLVDDSVEDIDFDADVDLVALTSILPQVPRAIDIADRFRLRGIPVIMGGIGANSVPDYVMPHVDALIKGEAENTWEQALEDFQHGKLNSIYESDKPFDMENMKPARFDLLNKESYMRTSRAVSKHGSLRLPFETSRGCPHNCDFCFVTRYFGRKMRFRPIDEVVDELSHYSGSYVFFVDDNICINPDRAKELFRAMIPLKLRWIGSSHIIAARDPEMLRLAAAAGCVGLFIGLESLSAENLASVNKSFNLKRDVAEQLNAFRDAGINPIPNLVFGFDADTPESIYSSFEFMCELKIKIVYAFLLTPLPGTVLHDRMEEEGRILHTDYSLYDTAHVVFEPKLMTPEILQSTYLDAYSKFYSGRSILRRFSDVQAWLKPSQLRGRLHCLGGNLFFRNSLKNNIHPLAAGIPKR
jgi:radical SAM superfamily enzyme YgiQ (UPF0313 family)